MAHRWRGLVVGDGGGIQAIFIIGIAGVGACSSRPFVQFECRARLSIVARARRVRRYLWRRRRRFLPIGCGVGGDDGRVRAEGRDWAARAFQARGACAAPVAFSQCTRITGARTTRLRLSSVRTTDRSRRYQ
ncbi:unnamed protein product [Aphis gossypii]|uniref:Uncharacterized protein n=1 Tax=Aphis gossypii TaxID=80765 RepID=A0A9P0NQR5_APHGO|nr:unnamed protein product [Aphis gossypii]